ncbi:MAG: FAD-dependent oxidoreductase [Lachnospiraceae bacterium]|nr:FAD-dependent oxidoreductase [Lachnospiraceae bacterium]
MLQIDQIKMLITEQKQEETSFLQKQILKLLHTSPKEIVNWRILKKSLDARKKPKLYWIYRVAVTLTDEKTEARILKSGKNNFVASYHPVVYQPPVLKMPLGEQFQDRPVIIGTGPAGLLCGYLLACQGLRPILIERGKSLEQRKQVVEDFWDKGILDQNTNVQFGEGGAGTFSDGKLQTQVKDKTGRIYYILKTFVEHGAPEEILFLSKPHIGTDLLSVVVKSLREHMIAMGAEFYFETKMTGLVTGQDRICGVRVMDQQGERIIRTGCCILCIGHSARDTFLTLYDQGVKMEHKPFAVGLRVQHSQELINEVQYGEGWKTKHLPPADYKMSYTVKYGRSVYSFCMCPGGYVVNASSEPERTAVNGMSYHGRDSGNANSAIVVTVDHKDYGEGVFDGMRFQQELEHRAYLQGNGKLVLQRLSDFTAESSGKDEGTACAEMLQNDIEIRGVENGQEELSPKVKGQYLWGNIRGVLPESLSLDFKDAMKYFGTVMGGFDRPDTILCGIESRTSSPVKIIRGEDFQSNIRGLYPCGEGAGYAGGITSAALDGVKVAEKVIMLYNKPKCATT